LAMLLATLWSSLARPDWRVRATYPARSIAALLAVLAKPSHLQAR
jgi:hypothetical protein